MSPSIVPLGGTSTISVTVQTDVALAALKTPAKLFSRRNTILLAMLLPLAIAARRRRFSRLALILALGCGLAAFSGCGASRVIPSSGGSGLATPTAPGTYTLNVGASSAGLNHVVNVTLVVQ